MNILIRARHTRVQLITINITKHWELFWIDHYSIFMCYLSELIKVMYGYRVVFIFYRCRVKQIGMVSSWLTRSRIIYGFYWARACACADIKHFLRRQTRRTAMHMDCLHKYYALLWYGNHCHQKVRRASGFSCSEVLFFSSIQWSSLEQVDWLTSLLILSTKLKLKPSTSFVLPKIKYSLWNC